VAAVTEKSSTTEYRRRSAAPAATAADTEGKARAAFAPPAPAVTTMAAAAPRRRFAVRVDWRKWYRGRATAEDDDEIGVDVAKMKSCWKTAVVVVVARHDAGLR